MRMSESNKLAFQLLLTLVVAPVASVWADSPLADAAEKANWKRVKQLLTSKSDANQTQNDGTTALHWAAFHDSDEQAQRLIKVGAKVTAKNRYGVTALSLACANGNAKLVRRLLEAGADVHVETASGETPLMTAARTGKGDVVNALVKRGARVNDKERNQQTAIMWAAAEGHSKVVRLLIEAGADFRTPLKSGFTPFFFAVREGRIEVAMALLEAGVDVNEIMKPQSRGGRNPRYGTSGLLLAVENGHFELALRLLNAKADPNDQRSGFTPLHVLSWARKPNLGDGLDGEPAPIGSGKVTSLQLVRELVKHGADVNARLAKGRSGRGRLNRKGATPFLLACDTADIALMRILLELGADHKLSNADGCPPLLAAAGVGTMAPGEEAGTEDEAIEAVQLLLKLGADINAVDRNGETAMHGAAYKSLPKMVKLLDERGANIKIWNRKNKYGWTPVLIAEGHRPGNFKPAVATLAEVHRVMLAHGVKPPPLTPRKRTNSEYSKKKK